MQRANSATQVSGTSGSSSSYAIYYPLACFLSLEQHLVCYVLTGRIAHAVCDHNTSR